jgi:hypothetical protein
MCFEKKKKKKKKKIVSSNNQNWHFTTVSLDTLESLHLHDHQKKCVSMCIQPELHKSTWSTRPLCLRHHRSWYVPIASLSMHEQFSNDHWQQKHRHHKWHVETSFHLFCCCFLPFHHARRFLAGGNACDCAAAELDCVGVCVVASELASASFSFANRSRPAAKKSRTEFASIALR